jgi:hypothetical protein
LPDWDRVSGSAFPDSHSGAHENYDALSVQVRHAFSYNLQGQIGYSWSHALGLISIYNPYNLAFGYGSQSFDRRHALVSDLIWQEPKLANKYLNAVAGGWNLGIKVYIFSETPFSSTRPADSAVRSSRPSSIRTSPRPAPRFMRVPIFRATP